MILWIIILSFSGFSLYEGKKRKEQGLDYKKYTIPAYIAIGIFFFLVITRIVLEIII